jgi:hypothetical protein
LQPCGTVFSLSTLLLILIHTFARFRSVVRVISAIRQNSALWVGFWPFETDFSSWRQISAFWVRLQPYRTQHSPLKYVSSLGDRYQSFVTDVIPL